jgi:GTP1/Obg family GTP-binding protein
VKKEAQNNLISKAKETLKKEILLIENRTDISDDDKVTRIIICYTG